MPPSLEFKPHSTHFYSCTASADFKERFISHRISDPTHSLHFGVLKAKPFSFSNLGLVFRGLQIS